jgi:hypothetical protein
VDFVEAPKAIPESFRRSKMANLAKQVPAPQLSIPAASRQLSMAFESIGLRGLIPSERTKAVAHLAKILMQAVGVATQEQDDDEH